MKSNIIAEMLKSGQNVTYRPHGNSMTPIIHSGQKVTITPVTNKEQLHIGLSVYCKVNGCYFLHLITAIKGDQYQISNNHNHVNGWTTFKNIYGIVVKIS